MVDHNCSSELLDNVVCYVHSVFVLCNQGEKYDSSTPWASRYSSRAKDCCYMWSHCWITGSTYATVNEWNRRYNSRTFVVNNSLEWVEVNQLFNIDSLVATLFSILACSNQHSSNPSKHHQILHFV